jgi:branched-chain amino acid aminotransferase
MLAGLVEVLWIGGRFVAEEEATVSLLDPGYLLGDGVFATLRGYGGACFRPEEHLAGLARGAEMFGIPVPVPLARLAELADEAARRTGAADAYVRVTLTRGVSDGRPTLSIIARAMVIPEPHEHARGVAVVTVAARRVPPACIDGTVKSTSYGVQVLARREVAVRGAAEGIQLAVDGALACGTMSTLFVVAGRRLLTPSLESGCRAGVTREALLALAASVGLDAAETRLEPPVLRTADEVFLASTRIECLPVATVDGATVGGGRYPATHALRAALRARVEAETAPRRPSGEPRVV